MWLMPLERRRYDAAKGLRKLLGCLDDGICWCDGWIRDVFVFENYRFGSSNSSCFSIPTPVVLVVDKRSAGVKTRFTFDAPSSSSLRVFKHLDFGTKWRERMTIGIVRAVQDCPGTHVWCNVCEA